MPPHRMGFTLKYSEYVLLLVLGCVAGGVPPSIKTHIRIYYNLNMTTLVQASEACHELDDGKQYLPVLNTTTKLLVYKTLQDKYETYTSSPYQFWTNATSDDGTTYFWDDYPNCTALPSTSSLWATNPTGSTTHAAYFAVNSEVEYGLFPAVHTLRVGTVICEKEKDPCRLKEKPDGTCPNSSTQANNEVRTNVADRTDCDDICLAYVNGESECVGTLYSSAQGECTIFYHVHPLLLSHVETPEDCPSGYPSDVEFRTKECHKISYRDHVVDVESASDYRINCTTTFLATNPTTTSTSTTTPTTTSTSTSTPTTTSTSTTTPTTTSTSTTTPTTTSTSTTTPTTTSTSTTTPTTTSTSTTTPTTTSTSTTTPTTTSTSTATPTTTSTSTTTPTTTSTSTTTPTTTSTPTTSPTTTSTSTTTPTTTSTSTTTPTTTSTSTTPPTTTSTSTTTPTTTSTPTTTPTTTRTSTTTKTTTRTSTTTSPTTSTSSTVTTVNISTTTIASRVPLFIRSCLCSTNSFKNLSIDAVTEMLVKELTVDTSKVSATIRAKTSAKDGRSSSVSIGTIAIVFMLIPMCLMLTLDATRFCSNNGKKVVVTSTPKLDDRCSFDR